MPRGARRPEVQVSLARPSEMGKAGPHCRTARPASLEEFGVLVAELGGETGSLGWEGLARMLVFLLVVITETRTVTAMIVRLLCADKPPCGASH